jgi:predicted TIM-barrel fold metal-dependent hydrolase
MSIAQRTRPVPRPFIDACVFHDWGSLPTLASYLPEGWRELLLRPHDHFGPVNVKSARLYSDPLSDQSHRGSSEAATDPNELATAIGLSDGNTAVLGYDEGMLATSFANYHVAHEVARAANAWTIDTWLNGQETLFGMVMVSTSIPDRAAAEIWRTGEHKRMVAVALGCNCLDTPFGHEIYYPIFEAASALRLPLVLQAGSDATADCPSTAVGGGQPSTFAEYRALGPASHMAHISSLIIRGVFESFPRLLVLLVGGGLTWIVPWLWRLDLWYKGHAHEVPWLTKLPSAYFVEHVRVATHGLELTPDTDRLAQYLSCFPGLERVVIYASCYPASSSEMSSDIAARLPPSWHAGVFRENAGSFFRWPTEMPSATALDERGE